MRFLLLPVFTLCFSLAASAAPERIEATYDLIWKGFHVSTAETVTELDDGKYFLGINVKTHGLLKMATGGHGTFEISGKLLPGGKVQPETFEADGFWDGGVFSQTLEYDADGALAASKSARPAKWLKKNAREDVPAGLQQGPDPASLLVALMQDPLNFEGAGAGQQLNMRSFDGDTVVDWALGCAAEPVMLKPSKHSPHGGEAIECEIATILIAGKLLQEDKPRKMTRRGPRGRRAPVDVTDVTPKVWLMAVGDKGRLLPVRAEVPSGKGMVGLFLSRLMLTDAGTVSGHGAASDDGR